MSYEKEPWFAPKYFGYGAGLPITWQGWALLLGYMLLVIGSAFWLAERSPAIFFAIMLAATISLILIARGRTRGGWHWRWGGDETPRRKGERRGSRERRRNDGRKRR
jgi:hypothetical protein